MTKYAIIDDNGLVIGTGEAGSEADALASGAGMGEVLILTADQNPVGCFWDGALFQPLPPSPGIWAQWNGSAWVEPRPLEDVRGATISQINHIRGETRGRFITPLPGQDMVYLEKERTARAWMADPEPDPVDYPGIMAEVGPGLTGETPFQVAFIYIHMAEQWRQISSLIESVSIRYLNLAEQEQDLERLKELPAEYSQTLEALLP